MYIFSYGSLRNKKSRELTLPGERYTKEVILRGYVKKFNAQVNGYLYLNIVPKEESRISGTVIKITPEEFGAVKAREIGYVPYDVGPMLEPSEDGPVYAFIAPDIAYPGLKIPRSYINTCSDAVPESEKRTWLVYTIIENEIEEDRADPVYVNVPIPKHK